MTDNPFATPTAPVQPPAREVPATTQPYAFIAVLALVTCLSFAVSLASSGTTTSARSASVSPSTCN